MLFAECPPIYELCMMISDGRTEQYIIIAGFSAETKKLGHRTPVSDGRKKEIYRDVRFFHGALQLCQGTES